MTQQDFDSMELFDKAAYSIGAFILVVGMFLGAIALIALIPYFLGKL